MPGSLVYLPRLVTMVAVLAWAAHAGRLYAVVKSGDSPLTYRFGNLDPVTGRITGDYELKFPPVHDPSCRWNAGGTPLGDFASVTATFESNRTLYLLAQEFCTSPSPNFKTTSLFKITRDEMSMVTSFPEFSTVRIDSFYLNWDFAGNIIVHVRANTGFRKDKVSLVAYEINVEDGSKRSVHPNIPAETPTCGQNGGTCWRAVKGASIIRGGKRVRRRTQVDGSLDDKRCEDCSFFVVEQQLIKNRVQFPTRLVARGLYNGTVITNTTDDLQTFALQLLPQRYNPQGFGDILIGLGRLQLACGVHKSKEMVCSEEEWGPKACEGHSQEISIILWYVINTKEAPQVRSRVVLPLGVLAQGGDFFGETKAVGLALDTFGYPYEPNKNAPRISFMVGGNLTSYRLTETNSAEMIASLPYNNVVALTYFSG